MDVLTAIVVSCISFGRNTIGLIVRPYETYRRIVDRGRIGELGVIFLFLVLYFSVASVVKVSAFRPFLLTRQFVILGVGAGLGFVIMIGAIWIAGLMLKGKGRLARLALGWGYTLLPTLAWFFITSLLYVLVPPPRTTSAMGILFSVLFIVFSVTLLWWKIMLSYLTIRFVFRFDVIRIIAVFAIVSPVIVAHSILMYYYGVFKVPFL